MWQNGGHETGCVRGCIRRFGVVVAVQLQEATARGNGRRPVGTQQNGSPVRFEVPYSRLPDAGAAATHLACEAVRDTSAVPTRAKAGKAQGAKNSAKQRIANRRSGIANVSSRLAPFALTDERLYFADEPRISSISFRKCNTRSSASRSTAVSHSGGGERCARASGLSRAWRIEATETFNAFAKSSWPTRENRRSVAFLKVMYAVPLTTVPLVYYTAYNVGKKGKSSGRF